MHGGDIDDSTEALLAHLGKGESGGVVDGAEVDGEDEIPLFAGEVGNGCNMLDSSVVDEDIEAAELALGGGDQSFNVVDFRQVRLAVLDLVLRARLRSDSFELGRGVGIEAVEHDVDILHAGEGLGNAVTDTGHGASDENGGHLFIILYMKYYFGNNVNYYYF